jgi:DNA-binding transcriptional ArsR family regulator
MTATFTDDQLDAMYAALADRTRRGILASLTAGEATVTELAAPFDASLQSISQHVQVLERAGLISRRKYRQTRPCRLEPDALRAATGWIEKQRRLWEARSDRLDRHLAKLPRTPRRR